MNDKNQVMQELWQEVRDNPEKVIASYNNYLDNFLGKTEQEKSEYYNQVKNDFNQNPSALAYAFLINASEAGQRYDEKNNFNANPNISSEENIITKEDFAQRVTLISKLLKENNVTITCQDFKNSLENVTDRDVVILDPPYPDPFSTLAYERHQASDLLYKDLQEKARELQNLNIPFAMPYEVLYFSGEYYPINPFQDIEHYIRFDEMHGGYIESIYSNNNSKPTDPNLVKYKDVLKLVKEKDISIIDAYNLCKDSNPQAVIEVSKEGIKDKGKWVDKITQTYQEHSL